MAKELVVLECIRPQYAQTNGFLRVMEYLLKFVDYRKERAVLNNVLVQSDELGELLEAEESIFVASSGQEK